jgi:hypothetical protein
MNVFTRKQRFSRRAFLRSTGLAAGMVPLITAERALGAAANGYPKRLAVVNWCNGVIKSSFTFDGTTFGETLKPLTPWAKKVILPTGLGLNVATYAGHFSWGAIWTGNPKGRTGMGPSIDQTISDSIAKKVQLPVSLMNTGVRVIGDGQPSSWRSAGVKNQWEIDPVRMFNKVFAGATTPNPMTPVVDTARIRRKSVLDFVGRELTAFRNRLGVEDKARIDAHQESLRDIEKRLTVPAGGGGGGGGAGCVKPMTAATKDVPLLTKTMYDLIAAAFKCDVCRVATIDLYDDGGGDGNSFPWLGINRDYHAVAHAGGGAAADKIKIDSYLYSQVAGLVKQLDDTAEGNGTMLDNSLVVVGNGQEDGASHKVQPIPFALIGSAGGFFKTGRSVAFPNQPHNKLLATICNAFDLPVTGYGVADKSGTITAELTS